jgi:hypothetical protein
MLFQSEILRLPNAWQGYIDLNLPNTYFLYHQKRGLAENP